MAHAQIFSSFERPEPTLYDEVYLPPSYPFEKTSRGNHLAERLELGNVYLTGSSSK